jgi:formamidopyrimidine-DNA glycosylase
MRKYNMPEGPEVKITTDFLNQFAGKSFHSFAVLSGRYAKKGGIDNDSFAKLPAVLKSADCKGKFIYLTLEHEKETYYLFSTLGMTGMWSRNKTKHSRFCIFFDDEDVLYYNDIRNFGTLKFVSDKKDLDKKLKSLGPDILTAEIDCQGFRNRFIKKQNKTIAECLMNQSVIAGVGNYLKAEILWNSKMSPNRLVKDITSDEWHDLYYNTLTQSQRSYKLGGATIESYRQPNGKEGLYSRRFAVYNQKTDPNGRAVIKETTADKRTTHWVPEIQK